MTELGAGFDPHADVRRSRRAATEHARGVGLDGQAVRLRWTPGNIARLLGLLAVAAAAVAGVLQWGYSVGRDEAASRAEVEKYFDAVRRGEMDAGFTWSCGDVVSIQDWGAPPEVVDALSAASIEKSGVAIGHHYDGHRDLRLHDFEIPGRAQGTVMLKATDGSEQEWRVCGLLSDVELLSPA